MGGVAGDVVPGVNPVVVVEFGLVAPVGALLLLDIPAIAIACSAAGS